MTVLMIAAMYNHQEVTHTVCIVLKTEFNACVL